MLFGDEHVQRYIATDGAEGHEWQPGVLTLLLTTTGRRSGRARTTPLIYGEHDGGYVIVASKGGAPEHPAWYYNVVKNPDVLVQDGTSQQALRARELGEGPERDAWWERAVQTFPSYADYQEKTDRLIPLFVLEPLRG